MVRKISARKISSRILFFCSLLITVFYINNVMSFKYGDGIYDLDIFYEQEENTIDAMFFGSSHIFEDVNTAVLWHDFGIASYTLCGSVQPLWNTYYYLNEALKYQTPKLIVVDMYLAGMNTDYSDDSRIIKNNFGLKPSLDKIKSVMESSPKDTQIDYLLEYPTYHSRYNELTKADFLPYQANENFFKNWKGNGTNFLTTPLVKPEVDQMIGTLDIPTKSLLYLQKIIDLSKEKNIPLLLVSTPYQLNSNEQAIYNSVEVIAKNENIAFINFNNMYDEIGLDFNSDFADRDHLNHRGNVKFSAYLGKYIDNTYDIPDRRKDDNYQSYNENLTNWAEQLSNQRLKETNILDEYLALLNTENLITIISVNGDIINNLSENQLSSLNNLGIGNDVLKQNSVAITKGGNLIFTSEESSQLSWSYDLPESAVLNIRKDMININGINYVKPNSGLDITTYNLRTNEVVEYIYVDKENINLIKR